MFKRICSIGIKRQSKIKRWCFQNHALAVTKFVIVEALLMASACICWPGESHLNPEMSFCDFGDRPSLTECRTFSDPSVSWRAADHTACQMQFDKETMVWHQCFNGMETVSSLLGCLAVLSDTHVYSGSGTNYFSQHSRNILSEALRIWIHSTQFKHWLYMGKLFQITASTTIDSIYVYSISYSIIKNIN